jgi:hypothetical protein
MATTHTVDYVVKVKPSGTWLTVTKGAILEVSGDESTGGSDDNPFAFGARPTKSMTIKGVGSVLRAYTWERTPVSVDTIIDSVTVKTFVGIIGSYDGDNQELTWHCVDMLVEIGTRARDLFSPQFVGVALATATTATSIEDPLDLSYEAGPINWGLWQTGGRPLDQAATYPTADYYYDCEHALCAADVAWYAGEDGLDIMLQMAQAAGGQIFQDSDGTVRFRSVLNVGSVTGTPTYTFSGIRASATDDMGVYAKASDMGDTAKYATKFVSTYTPRYLRPMQEVIDDTQVRLVRASDAAHTIVIEPQWPLNRIEVIAPNKLAADKINAIWMVGTTVPQGAGGYNQTITLDAQRLTIVISNTVAAPFIIRNIKVNGEPWLAGETGRVEVGSGNVKRDVVNNPFVQYEDHAKQLTGMAVAFYGVSHPIITLESLPFDTRRYLGEIIYVTDTDLGIAHVLHVIVGRTIRSMHEVDYKVARLGTAPVGTDFFEIGTTDYTGQTKYVAW